MQRTWVGRIRDDAGAEHDRFVAWLSSGEGGQALGRALLSGYRLSESDQCLLVQFSGDDPLALVRFLRNHRFWPEYWEFESADPAAEARGDWHERFRWSRADPALA